MAKIFELRQEECLTPGEIINGDAPSEGEEGAEYEESAANHFGRRGRETKVDIRCCGSIYING